MRRRAISSGVVQVKLAVGGARWTWTVFPKCRIRGQPLCWSSLGDHADDFALALRERLETVAEVGDFALAAALGEVVRDGVFNGLEEALVVDGLLKEVDGARLQGVDGHVDVAVAGNEDDRQVAAGFPQLELKLKAGHVRHADVEEETAGADVVVRGKERDGVGIGLDVPAFAFNEEGPGVAHCVVIVDDADQGLVDFRRIVHGEILVIMVVLGASGSSKGRRRRRRASGHFY